MLGDIQQRSNKWDWLPIYVGYQAPYPQCTDHYQYYNLFTDTNQDYSFGKAAADDAILQMKNLGLGTPSGIYYDMEAYKPGNYYNGVSCAAIAESFLKGWVDEIYYTSGWQGSIYGSSGGSAVQDWASFPNPPSNIFYGNSIQGQNCNCTWNDPNISNSYWSFDQRIHQYSSTHTEQHGGVNYSVDNNCAVAMLAGSQQGEGVDDEMGGSPSEDPSC